MNPEGEKQSWRDLLTKSLDLGLGALMLTKEAAQKAIDELVSKGEVTKDEGKHLLQRMIERGKEEKERVEKLVKETVDRALEKADLARAAELREARVRLAELEQRLERLEMGARSGHHPPHEPPT
jgi:polyhydroxyalkanoate synthesis regulator phasin